MCNEHAFSVPTKLFALQFAVSGVLGVVFAAN
jgi:hypothetical protein